MHVFGRRFGQRVAQQFSDGSKRYIVHDRGRGKAVAQIMHAQVGQSTATPEFFLPSRNVDRFVALAIGEHKWTAGNSLNTVEDRQHFAVEPDDLRACLLFGSTSRGGSEARQLGVPDAVFVGLQRQIPACEIAVEKRSVALLFGCGNHIFAAGTIWPSGISELLPKVAKFRKLLGTT